MEILGMCSDIIVVFMKTYTDNTYIAANVFSVEVSQAINHYCTGYFHCFYGCRLILFLCNWLKNASIYALCYFRCVPES